MRIHSPICKYAKTASVTQQAMRFAGDLPQQPHESACSHVIVDEPSLIAQRLCTQPLALGVSPLSFIEPTTAVRGVRHNRVHRLRGESPHDLKAVALVQRPLGHALTSAKSRSATHSSVTPLQTKTRRTWRRAYARR